MSFWDFVPTLIETGFELWGASQTSKAQSSAAQSLTASQSEAARLQSNAQSEATAAEQASIAAMQENYKRLQTEASTGLLQMQDVINRGEALTPAQSQALNDARRTTLNTLQGGSLRGSARATAETVADVEGRMRNQYIDINRSRADRAALDLSGQYFNQGNNIANASLRSGTSASQGLLNIGNIQAGSELYQGRVDAANTIGQDQIKGKAIGDISAVISDLMKVETAKAREENYKPPEKGA